MQVKCTSCGATQDINEAQNCNFCGSIIVDNKEISNKIDKLNANGNLFKLAEVAFEGGDYDEALNYYNKCLEIEADFFEAWYKKGLSILKTSTIGNFKSQQAISAFNQAINNSPNSDSFKKRLKKDIIPFICDYYIITLNHFINFKNLPNSGLEFSEKIGRANDTVEYIIQNVGLEINEVKKIHEALMIVGTKVGAYIVELSFKKGGYDKIKNDLSHITDRICYIRDEVIEPIWLKLEPETVPKKKKGCFIATATMGSYNHPVVVDLRIFRDQWLLKRKWGIKFTNTYYIYGAKAAKVIERSVLLKRISYCLLVKPLQLITRNLR